MIADHLAELECAEATAWMFVPSLPVAPNADRAWPELRRVDAPASPATQEVA